MIIISRLLFGIFTLSVIVKGAWWVAAAKPVILSFGAAFAVLNLDIQPLFDINWKNLLTFKKDKYDKNVSDVPADALKSIEDYLRH